MRGSAPLLPLSNPARLIRERSESTASRMARDSSPTTGRNRAAPSTRTRRRACRCWPSFRIFFLYHLERLAGGDPATPRAHPDQCVRTEFVDFCVLECRRRRWRCFAGCRDWVSIPVEERRLSRWSTRARRWCFRLAVRRGDIRRPPRSSRLGRCDVAEGSRVALLPRRAVVGNGGVDRIPRRLVAGDGGGLRAGRLRPVGTAVEARDRQRGADCRAPALSRTGVRELLHDGRLRSRRAFLQPGKVAGFFGVPNPEILLRMLFGAAGRGLFWQTPVLLLSLWGVGSWYRSGRRAFLAFVVANIVLLSRCRCRPWPVIKAA